MPNTPTIHILLATYNGEPFLKQQLESIAHQTFNSWTLTVSDDGSTDNTLAIVECFANRVHQTVNVLNGPSIGSSTANFCHLIAQAPSGKEDDLYAYCDQDDVWDKDKLIRAAKWHSQHLDQPVRLYCGRTQFVNEKLHRIGLSPDIKRPPSFGNALVQNIASGNTMVFSNATLITQKKIKPENCVWHDWTTYLVATSLGGLVLFDSQPSLLYRQHGGNVIGSNDSLLSTIKRLKPLTEGRFKTWTEKNLKALQDIKLIPHTKEYQLYEKFIMIRTEPIFWLRIRKWLQTNIRRQSPLSNLTLAIALVFKLI